MGHSFGGGTALLAAHKDDRLMGCIALDPWMFPLAEERFQLAKPVLVINTEMFVNAANVGKLREVAGQAHAAVLQGAVHLMHTDAHFLFRSNLIKGSLGNNLNAIKL
jgi:dienelactone hydrolase